MSSEDITVLATDNAETLSIGADKRQPGIHNLVMSGQWGFSGIELSQAKLDEMFLALKSYKENL